MIIVEDDLLLSPDFLEYFEANAPILERDADTLVLSAWNDNGYRGRVNSYFFEEISLKNLLSDTLFSYVFFWGGRYIFFYVGGEGWQLGSYIFSEA